LKKLGSVELNRIYQMDCLKGMDLIPDGSIDMVLCDLPYGTTQNKWDTPIDLERLWGQYNRIVKDNGAIVLTAQTPFDKILGSSNIENLKYEWIWVKNIATGHLNAKRMPMKEHENILVFYKKPPTYNPQMTDGEPYINKRKPKNDSGTNYGEIKRTDTINEGKRYPKSVLYFDREIGLHPTQKPVSLFEYMIKTYTNEGDIVLDNCIGSGATAVAAEINNRNWVGFELEKEYIEKANKRLDAIDLTLDLDKL